jgi:hypothetical protein
MVWRDERFVDQELAEPAPRWGLATVGLGRSTAG